MKNNFDQPNDMSDSEASAWAKFTAQSLLDEFKDSSSIDTGGYCDCDFILAAAKLALDDPALATRIGKLMEPPRPHHKWKG